MEPVFSHWQESAIAYGTDLRATTKTWTAKILEIEMLAWHLVRATSGSDRPVRVLEVGCGNGVNCIQLARRVENVLFDGVDYVPEMITSAQEGADRDGLRDRLRFFVGDVRDLGPVEGLHDQYDFVFTDRCLINLADTSEQKMAISMLATKVRTGGHLVMIENSVLTFAGQNRQRELVGLPARSPAQFNRFLDDAEILPHWRGIGFVADVHDFIGLHDLVLYVLVPATNGGTVDYEHPLVAKATELNRAAISLGTAHQFGPYGQNRVYAGVKSGVK